MRFDDLILELRSAAATLRAPTGSFLPAQDRITAELIDRAALALSESQEFKVMAYQEVLPTDDPDVFDAKIWALPPGMKVPDGCTPLYWRVGENVPHYTSLNGDKCFTVEDLARAFPLPRSTLQSPEWSEFPAWVNFIAMDSDGRWHGFGKEPYVEDSFGGNLMGWDVIDGGSMAYRDRNAPHVAGWRESLRERPEASA
ncbi:hypothetical protein [Stenotrophomonas sp. UBA7606]|uniref:hypothetical protein n=1 Tax=Stenotrophomonas sp. UBA7606 TaxID=1947559 RepID=UPI0025FB212E|nr:hypothetical protein [Stenotrophomonas sp. UBA7606]